MDQVTWLMSCPVAGAPKPAEVPYPTRYAQSLRHLGSMLDRYAVSWLSIIEGSHGPTKSGNDGGEFRASWNLQSLIAGFEVKQLSLALSLLDISFCLK